MNRETTERILPNLYPWQQRVLELIKQGRRVTFLMPRVRR